MAAAAEQTENPGGNRAVQGLIPERRGEQTGFFQRGIVGGVFRYGRDVSEYFGYYVVF